MERDVVLVTGGNSGIGFQCAFQLAREGQRVLIANEYSRSEYLSNACVPGTRRSHALSRLGRERSPRSRH